MYLKGGWKGECMKLETKKIKPREIDVKAGDIASVAHDVLIAWNRFKIFHGFNATMPKFNMGGKPFSRLQRS